MARLIIEDGPEPGKEFPIGDRAVIGRLPGSEVALASDENVSRRHARLYRSGSGFEVVDLGSANGTTVNGAKISGSYALRTGDRVKVGGTTLRFVEEVAGAEARPSEAPAKTAVAADSIELRAAGTGSAEPAPRSAAAAAAAAGAVRVEVKNETLQFSPYKDSKGGATALGEDLGQRSALFRAVMVVVALAIAAGVFWVVKGLTASVVAPKAPSAAPSAGGEPEPR